MSEEDGGFLARWSRRKAAARDEPAVAPTDTPPPDLPPIESLGPNSDYSVFLARGVSRAIQTQALGVAWASDPAIANFRGMAEYAWDFNAPGYGALAAGDDAAVWLSQIVRSGTKLVMDAERPPVLAEIFPPSHLIGPSPVLVEEDRGEGCFGTQTVAVQQLSPPHPGPLPPVGAGEAAEPDSSALDTAPALPSRRRHGGAVPA